MLPTREIKVFISDTAAIKVKLKWYSSESDRRKTIDELGIKEFKRYQFLPDGLVITKEQSDRNLEGELKGEDL